MVRWTEAQPVADTDTTDEPYDEPRGRSGKVTAFLVLLALVFLAYGVVRVLSLEDNAFLVAAMTFTPYVAAGSLLLGLVTLALRRWLLGSLVLVITLSLGSLLGPRYLSEEQPQATGPHLRVMAASPEPGDARTLVDLVKRQEVDVLTLQGLTPGTLSALDSAGLRNVLSYRVLDGTETAGIVANVPLRQIILVQDSTLAQPSAVVDLDGNGDIEITAVHIRSPLDHGALPVWRRELAQLPRSTPDKRVRVLAGDFNATFDHVAYRDLLDRGYADAAEETGEGLTPTFTSWPTTPPVTVDHIVADGRCAVSSYATFDLPGSDHAAIMAEIVLP